MENQKKAYIFAGITVLLWSSVATAFKLSLRYLDPVQLLLYSCFTSVIVLGAILVFQGKFRLIFSYTRGEYLLSLLLGVLNPFLYYLVLFKAYDLLPAQEAQPINYTWAITMTLLAIPLLKQKISGRDMLATIISYAGVVIISTHGDVLGFRFSNPVGVGLALFSTVIWALYWIYNTKDTKDPVVGLFLNFLFGLPVIFGACLASSSLCPAGKDFVPGLLGAAYVGIFEMGVAFVLWLYALKLSVNTAKVGNLIFVSPFLSLVFIHFLLGEAILPSTYAGLVLIVTGLLIQRLKR